MLMISLCPLTETVAQTGRKKNSDAHKAFYEGALRLVLEQDGNAGVEGRPAQAYHGSILNAWVEVYEQNDELWNARSNPFELRRVQARFAERHAEIRDYLRNAPVENLEYSYPCFEVLSRYNFDRESFPVLGANSLGISLWGRLYTPSARGSYLTGFDTYIDIINKTELREVPLSPEKAEHLTNLWRNGTLRRACIPAKAYYKLVVEKELVVAYVTEVILYEDPDCTKELWRKTFKNVP